MLQNILSCLSGYLDSKEFELDIPKIADVSEMSEEEVIEELHTLHSNGEIQLNDNKVILTTISPKNSKKFNDLWTPVETMVWKKNTKLKLDV